MAKPARGGQVFTKVKGHWQLSLPVIGACWSTDKVEFINSCFMCSLSPSVQFSTVQSLSRVRLFATPWITAWQASLSITNSQSSLKLMSIESVMPSSHLILCHPAISSSVIPFSFGPQSLPASESFPMSQHFTWGGQSVGVSALDQSFQWTPGTDLQNGLVGSPCSPRDSQESSPTPQFKSINSLVLSFRHSLTLTSIHDYWKNHSLN